MNEIIFTDPTLLKRVLPWAITAVLLLSWSYCVFTANGLGGFAHGFLISGAAMVLVSLYFGRKLISQAALA